MKSPSRKTAFEKDLDRNQLKSEIVVIEERQEWGMLVRKWGAPQEGSYWIPRTNRATGNVIDYPPPRGSVWLTEWHPRIDASTDSTGWQYAKNFNSKDWHNNQGVFKSRRRRRCWARKSIVLPKLQQEEEEFSMAAFTGILTGQTCDNHEEQIHETVFERLEWCNVSRKWVNPAEGERFSFGGKHLDNLNSIPLPPDDKFGDWHWACCWKIILSPITDEHGWVKGDSWHYLDNEKGKKIRMWKRVAIFVRSYANEDCCNLNQLHSMIRRTLKNLFLHALLNSDNAIGAGVQIYPDAPDFEDMQYVLKDVEDFNWAIAKFQIRLKCLSFRSSEQWYEIKELRAEYSLQPTSDYDSEKQMFQLLMKTLRWIKKCIVRGALHEDIEPFTIRQRDLTFSKLSKICCFYTEVKHSDQIAMRCLGCYVVATYLEAVHHVGSGFDCGLFIFSELRKNAKKAEEVERNHFQELGTFHIDLLDEMKTMLEIVDQNLDQDQELSDFEAKVLKAIMDKTTKLISVCLDYYHRENLEIVYDTFYIYLKMRAIYENQTKATRLQRTSVIKPCAIIEYWMKTSAKELFDRMWTKDFSVDLSEEEMGSEAFKEKWENFIQHLLSHIHSDIKLCHRIRNSGVLMWANQLTHVASHYMVSQLISIILKKIKNSKEKEHSLDNLCGNFLMSVYNVRFELNKMLKEKDPNFQLKDKHMKKLISRVEVEADKRFRTWIHEQLESRRELTKRAVEKTDWKQVADEKFSDVVVDVFKIWSLCVDRFFKYMERLPDSFAKHSKEFFGCLLRLISTYLSVVDQSTRRLLYDSNDITDEQKSGTWEAGLGQVIKYQPFPVEDYSEKLKGLCVRYSSITKMDNYLDKWEEEFKNRISACFTEVEFSDLVQKNIDLFFTDARLEVKDIASETEAWLVRQIVYFQLRPKWQRELWMPRVKENGFDQNFFDSFESYLGVLDEGLNEAEYNSFLLRIMREVNNALVWILTDEYSKSTGRVFEPSDCQCLFRDVDVINKLFIEWGYTGAGSDSATIIEGNPLLQSKTIIGLISQETSVLKTKADEILKTSKSSRSNLKADSLSLILRVLSMRPHKDKVAGEYLLLLKSKWHHSTSFFKPQAIELEDLAVNLVGSQRKKSILTIQVINGRNLIACDVNGFSDPYVIVTVAGQQKRTKVRKKTLTPVWKESMSYEIPYKYFEINDMLEVYVNCYDFDYGRRDDLIGHARYTIRPNQQSQKLSLDLKSNEPGGSLSRGEIFILVDTSQMHF